MAQHGYLREYDEGWGGSDERDRWRRDRGDERSQWRGDDRNERNLDFMLGDRDRSWDGQREHGWSGDRHDRDRDRGFFDRTGYRAQSWMGDDDHRQHGMSPDHPRHSGGQSDWERAPRNFSSHQDDHYRSWRDNQMRSLDRDYEDYCREREQQFHQDFDSWRQKRQQQQPPMGESGQRQGQRSQMPVMDLDTPAVEGAETMAPNSPMADATLGTNNSENNITAGRGRR